MPTTIDRYVNTVAHTSGDGTTNGTGNGGTNSYVSLSEAITGLAKNLVTADQIMVIHCEGSAADTVGVNVDGFTTDATRYLVIQVDQASRHDGKWNTSKYRIEANNATPIAISDDHVRVIGLQLTVTSPTGDSKHCFRNTTALAAGAETHLSHTICKGHGNNSWTQGGIVIDGANVVHKSWNNIIYGLPTNSTGVWALTGTSCTVYSTTVVGGDYGIRNDGLAITAKNCYAGNTTTADYQGSITKTTCYSEDGTGSPATSIAPTTATFVNVTGGTEDFHLVSGSGLIDVGTDTSGDAAPFNFTTDIDGASRAGTWDVGADDYSAVTGPSSGTDTATAGLTDSMRPVAVTLSIAESG